MRLKFYRLKQNMLQRDVAKSVNVSRSTVTKWETGEAVPRTDKLKKLAALFNCTVDDLLKDDESASARVRTAIQ